ncbi:MAG: ABC transporter permease [Anaerolineales bacterium]
MEINARKTERATSRNATQEQNTHRTPRRRNTFFRASYLTPLRWALAPLLGLLLYIAWVGAVRAELFPAFILPHPADILARLAERHAEGRLWLHVWTTAQEALIGLAVAVALALPLGYGVARNRWLSILLMPYLVAIRAVPVVAIAAVVVILLGTGLRSKVFVAAFITWFPLMEATIIGIQSVDPNLRSLMRSYRATPWQTFVKLELPSALPNILSGMTVAATLSVVGAAVGELISSSQGLAYLIALGRGTGDTALVFGAVFLLTALSLALYGVVAALESWVLAWRRT